MIQIEANSPLVSVVIPTYKRGGRFLERALYSALNQTYTNYEIIVVDDNDPETSYRRETEMAIAKFSNYPRIRYIRHGKNMGGAVARNTGIREAKGSWVAFLDDDDEWLPAKIEKQIEKAEQSNVPNLAFIYCILKRVDGQGNIKGFRGRRISGNLLKYQMMHRITKTTSMLVKKDVLNAINGFRALDCGQDYDLILRILAFGYEIEIVEEVLAVVYEHNDIRITNSPAKTLGTIKNRLDQELYYHLLSPIDATEVKHWNSLTLSSLYAKGKDYGNSFKYLFRAISLRPLHPKNIRKLLFNVLHMVYDMLNPGTNRSKI